MPQQRFSWCGTRVVAMMAAATAIIVHKTTARPSSLPCLTETPRTAPAHRAPYLPRIHTRYLEKKNPPITVLLSPDFNTTDTLTLLLVRWCAALASLTLVNHTPDPPLSLPHSLLLLFLPLRRPCSPCVVVVVTNQVRRRAEWQPTTFPSTTSTQSPTTTVERRQPARQAGRHSVRER